MRKSQEYYADIFGSVAARDGKVHVVFSRIVDGKAKAAETDMMILDPVAAMKMAELLAAMAFEADTSLKPVSEAMKPALVEQHRKRMGPKAIMIIRTGIQEKTAPDVIARQVLDHCFSEIFS